MPRSESMRSGARRGAKLDPAVLSELMGHDEDGRIRRVMLTAPECVDVLSRLTVHPRESQSRAFWRASHPHLRANTGPIGRIPGREGGETEFTYWLTEPLSPRIDCYRRWRVTVWFPFAMGQAHP